MATVPARAGQAGRPSVEGRDVLAGVTVVAMATTLMLESTRVFVAYLVFVVDQSNRPTLGAVVFAVFAAIGLAGLLMRGDDVTGLAVAAAVAVAGLRVALQFWDEPVARVALGAAGIIAWGWCCIALLSAPAWRGAAGIGLVSGLAVDLLIRVGFGTLDLPWLPTTSKDLWTAALAALLVVAAAGVARGRVSRAGGGGTARALFAVGPGLALFHLLSGNVGLALVALGEVARLAQVVVAAGAVIPLLILAAPRNAERRTGWRGSSLVALLGAIGLYLTWPGGSGTPLTVLGGWLVLTATVLLLVRACALPVSGGREARTRGVAFWFTAGILVHAVLLFAYYTFSGPLLIVAVTYVLLCLAVWSGGRRAAAPAVAVRDRQRVAFAVMLVGLVAWLSGDADWDRPAAGPPLPAEFTVMTFNLQNGFAKDERFNLDGQARLIEQVDPDVLVLQEVSRGWLVTGGADMLLWLSQRLEMPYVWGPASRDDLWGNAILSRAPLSDADIEKFSRTQNLRRSVVRARVATEAGDVWVFGTHLDNPSGAGVVREEQVAQVLAFRGERSPALLLGDFNAQPDDAVIRAIKAAGFNDLGNALPPGTFTSEGRSRIDYIFATADLTPVSIQVVESDASDHKPVVARVRR